MKAFLLLCDAAQDYSQKLSILGGGWTRILEAGLRTNVALAGYLVFDPDEPEPDALEFTLRLLNEQGEPVLHGPDTGPIVVSAKLTSKRNEAAHRMLPLGVPLAIQIGNLKLEVGLYRWVLEIGDEQISEVVFEVAEKL